MTTKLRPLLVAVALILASGGVRAQDAADGWPGAWTYRLEVALPAPALRAGINTAQVDLADDSALCAEDGRDVRVVASDGRTVPHVVARAESGHLIVRFLVEPTVESVFIYFGDPAAPAVDHRWEEKLGGLTYETRRTGQYVQQAGQLPGLLDALRRQGPPLGRDENWPEINDLSNPWGPEDYYLSSYEGTIYCPTDGWYDFSLNADDAAVFYLGEGAGPLCSRNPGEPSQGWPEAPRDSAQRTRLARGVYRIRYIHAENSGAQLAALGWRVPGADETVLVPPEAFVRYLPADVTARQERGAALNAFFVAEHQFNLAVNLLDVRFANYRFESRSGDGLDCRWDFGDGTTGQGQTVEHEFPDAEPRVVRLTVRDGDGRSAELARTVVPPARRERRMALEMQVEMGEDGILHPGADLDVLVFLRNYRGVLRPVTVETATESLAPGGPRATDRFVLDDLAPTGQADGGWRAVSRSVPLPGGSVRVTVRATLHGRAVDEHRVNVATTTGPLGRLSVSDAGEIQGPDGDGVLLRLGHANSASVEPRRVCDGRDGTFSLLVFDQSLAGPPGNHTRTGYAAMLGDMLAEGAPGLTVNVERRAEIDGAEVTPPREFVRIVRDVRDVRPDVVVLVCRPEIVLDGTPLDLYESYLTAAVDQILSQTHADVMLVTPPPLPGRALQSRPYAIVMQRMAAVKGLMVADVYSRFRLTKGYEDLFRPEGGTRPAYDIAPNRRGQALIARTISASLRARWGDALAAAAAARR